MQGIVQESMSKVIIVDRYTYVDRHMQSRHRPMQSRHRQVYIAGIHKYKQSIHWYKQSTHDR